MSKKQTLEGKLVSINEVSPVFAEKHNGIIGPGGRSWNEKIGDKTTISVEHHSDEETKVRKITYYGLILPDSIGHTVKLFRTEDRVQIYDADLNRWYK